MVSKHLLQKYKQQYQSGQALFKEGEMGNKFYIIQEGTVNISKNIEGETVNIATVKSGEILGEMAILQKNKCRSATAKARTPLTCLELPAEKLDQLMEENEEFRNRLVKLLCRRIDNTSKKLSNYQKHDFLFQKTALSLLQHLTDWYDQQTKEININTDGVELLKSIDLSPEEIDKFLSIKSRQKLARLQPKEQEKLLKNTFKVLEKELENINIK